MKSAIMQAIDNMHCVFMLLISARMSNKKPKALPISEQAKRNSHVSTYKSKLEMTKTVGNSSKCQFTSRID